MSGLIDLSDKNFGNLMVIKRDINDNWGQSQWLCKCKCGKQTIVTGYHLRSGHTQSCGCIKGNIFHGYSSKTSKKYLIYKTWERMLNRCNNHNYPECQYYIGRGIKVCNRWKELNGWGFINFLNDMGERPKGTSLDRIDNNGDYEPNNCRWATTKEQSRNQRTNRLIAIDGEIKCLAEWCEKFGLLYETVYSRLRRGWPPEKALRVQKYKIENQTKETING